MCSNQHDGTCTAILSRSDTHADQLVMKLICEHCEEVVEVLGSIEHKFEPVLVAPSPLMSHA